MSSAAVSARAALDAVRTRVLSRTLGRLALATLVYVTLTAVVFWPLLTRLDSAVLLEPGDMSSTARDYWAAERIGETPFTLDHDPLLFAPQGQSRSPSVQVANAAQPAFVLLVEEAFGYLGALNLYMLLGFAGAAVVMFALLDRLRLHLAAALFGGAVFGFSWWQLEQAYYGHSGLNHIWVFPLLLLALLSLRRRQDFPAALAVGATLGLAFYLFSYLGLFAAVFAATFMGVDLVERARPRRVHALFLYGVALTTLLASLFPALLASVLLPSDLSTAFPTTKEFFFGASVYDYLIPSSHHPVLGGAATSLNNGLPQVGEAVVFFGWTVIALALLAGRWWSRDADERLANDDRRVALRTSVVLVPVGVLMSLPAYTTVSGTRVPLPDAAFVIGTFVNWWKIYSRFGILTGFGLAVLAAFALHVLVRRRTRPALVALVVAIAAFEAYPHVADRIAVVGDPGPAVEWLSEQPRGTVAHYPMLPEWRAYGATGWGAYAWRTVYDQTHHGQPLYAVPSLRPDGSRREAIRLLSTDLEQPLTPRVLRAQGVRYVVVHDDVYETLGEDAPDTASGLVLRGHFDESRVFEVTAEPTPSMERLLSLRAREIAVARGLGAARVTFGGGVHPAEPYRGYQGRWMTQGAEIEVAAPNPGYRTKWALVVRAFSNGIGRRLELVNADDRVLGSIDVQPIEEVQIIGTFYIGAEPTKLRLRASPGPMPLGPFDSRRATVFLAEVRAQPLPY